MMCFGNPFLPGGGVARQPIFCVHRHPSLGLRRPDGLRATTGTRQLRSASTTTPAPACAAQTACGPPPGAYTVGQQTSGAGSGGHHYPPGPLSEGAVSESD